MRALFLAAVLAAAGATAASAELVLEGVHWEIGRSSRRSSWQDVQILDGMPLKAGTRLRARAVLKNRGPLGAEGIVLRYGLTARLAGPGADSEGVWAVPFSVDVRRVPSIGPNKVVNVSLDAGEPLALYLRRLARSGWRADRVRLRVMLEPRPDVKALQVVEDTLEIAR